MSFKHYVYLDSYVTLYDVDNVTIQNFKKSRIVDILNYDILKDKIINNLNLPSIEFVEVSDITIINSGELVKCDFYLENDSFLSLENRYKVLKAVMDTDNGLAIVRDFFNSYKAKDVVEVSSFLKKITQLSELEPEVIQNTILSQDMEKYTYYEFMVYFNIIRDRLFPILINDIRTLYKNNIDIIVDDIIKRYGFLPRNYSCKY